MPGIGITRDHDVSIRAFGLHDRSRFQEEPGERDRFFERAAAVPAQIDDETGDVLLLQSLQQREHVLGRALLVLVHVGVKRWKGDPAQFHRLAVFVLLNNDVGARFLVLQLNLVAHQLDRLALRWVGRVRRNHEKPHFGALLAANLLDDFVETHVANVVKRSVALCHRADAVTDFQTAIRLRRAAGDETFDLGVTIFTPQHRADADEREAHVDTEVLQIGLAQIFGMRVVSLGERVEEELYLLFLVLFVDTASEAIVTARDQLRSGLDWMFAQMFLKQLARDPSTPDLIGVRFIFWPGRLLPAESQSSRRS